MSLAAGRSFGAYEIIAALGAGGMGAVFRVRDTRLNRDVALKLLPDGFSQDPDRIARREAQVLASLNQPNIGAIYGLEESGGAQAIVLELVEGETLADRLRRGAMPIRRSRSRAASRSHRTAEASRWSRTCLALSAIGLVSSCSPAGSSGKTGCRSTVAMMRQAPICHSRGACAFSRSSI